MRIRIEEFEKSGVFQEAHESFPLLDLVADTLTSRGHLSGVHLGWHCHLTALTAIAARALLASGATIALSECNPSTSDSAAIAYMKEQGIEIYTGPDSCERILSLDLDVISDTGFALTSSWLRRWRSSGKGRDGGGCGGVKPLAGSLEITTSGVTRLRREKELPIAIININDGQIKTSVENFHGVGGGLVEAVRVLTGTTASTASVVGYGRVGAGVAHYLQRTGTKVKVVEVDAVRQLSAHFDGFELASLREAISKADLMVTATGKDGLIKKDDWLSAKDGLLVVNVGHRQEELSLESLSRLSKKREAVSEHIDEYTILNRQGREIRVQVAVQGNPANVVLLTGSIQPTLIHLATELLSIEYLVTSGCNLSPGEHRVPCEVEDEVARLALQALGKPINKGPSRYK